MKNVKLIFIAILAVSIFLTDCASSGRSAGGSTDRFALIIGNSNYENLPHVRNPMHDAQDMAAMLRRLNFNVDLCMNTTLEQLRAAV
ncbi:MAG: caspase family protein, partial [Treponema sp.]|nr:caspase family protein [Treponema sp.]